MTTSRNDHDQAYGARSSNGTTPNGHTNGNSHEKNDPDVGQWLLDEKAHLPTADELKAPIEEDVDPARVTADWISRLARVSVDGDGFADLFWEYGGFPN